MREDGARASWDTIAAWLGIERPGPGPLQRARDAMAQAEALYGKRLSRGIGCRLYIGTMFRDSGQLWRLLLQTLDRLGNRDAFWRTCRAWTEEDWADAIRPLVEVQDAEARDALAERLVELCEGRGLLADLQLVRPTLDDTWAGIHDAGLDPRDVLGVQNEEEGRALLPRLFRFRTDRRGTEASEAYDAPSDVVQWAVALFEGGRLGVVVRLAERLPLEAIGSDDVQVRVRHPGLPRWNSLGESVGIVATYHREAEGWVLAGAPGWIEVPSEGLRIAARRNERPFSLPEFPPWGLLVRDATEGEILPALATPRVGEACVLVTSPDTEVEGLGARPESLVGGWVARRFRASASLSYTVGADGLSVSVTCGRAPVACPLRIDGRALPNAEHGRLTIGGRTVFVGMPRISARSAAIRRDEPIVRCSGPEGERVVAASWERGTLQIGAKEAGAWTVEEPEGRWRARFHVLAPDQLPQTAWTAAGIRLSLPREAGWSWGSRVARAAEFYAPLPTQDAGPTRVTAVLPGEPEYQWSFRGRAAEVVFLDAAGGVRHVTTLPRSEFVRGDLLRIRGPAGARVVVRVKGEDREERVLPSDGELIERASLLFREVDDRVGDLDVTVALVDTEVAATFTLFHDGATARPVGIPKNVELTTDEEGAPGLRLDVDGAEFDNARVGVVRLGGEVPWVGWVDARWHNEWRATALPLPPGTYGVVLRGDRRLPNGGTAADARTMAARLDVPGTRAAVGRELAESLAVRLRAQDCERLDLWAPRRRLAEVRTDLRQLAEVAQLLEGPFRAQLVREIAALPAAVPRLAWWVLRARAGLDEDPAIDEEVLGALEMLLLEVGWHPSWVRYAALPLLLPPWPSGGYPEWEGAARAAVDRIGGVFPNLRIPLETLLRPEVAVGLVHARGRWPRALAMEAPTVLAGRPVSVDVPPGWEQRVRGLFADKRKDATLSFADAAFRAVERVQAGMDVILARKVLLEAILLREIPARPTREDLDRWSDLLRWTVHVEADPALAERARAWERTLLRRFPLTPFAS